jgi:hypothetical protein
MKWYTLVKQCWRTVKWFYITSDWMIHTFMLWVTVGLIAGRAGFSLGNSAARVAQLC